VASSTHTAQRRLGFLRLFVCLFAIAVGWGLCRFAFVGWDSRILGAFSRSLREYTQHTKCNEERTYTVRRQTDARHTHVSAAERKDPLVARCAWPAHVACHAHVSAAPNARIRLLSSLTSFEQTCGKNRAQICSGQADGVQESTQRTRRRAVCYARRAHHPTPISDYRVGKGRCL
jgi:hypothetical protein